MQVFNNATAQVTPPPGLARSCYAWLRLHPYSVMATLLMLGFLIPYLLRNDFYFDFTYLDASRHMLAGHDIYHLPGGYAYPPCKALFALPFLLLPVWAQRLAWWACNAVCLVLLCRGAWRLTGGGRLEGESPAPRSEHLIWLLGLVTGIFYISNSLSNQATDLVEAVLLVTGCVALAAGRELRAALWLGLAAAIKATPLLWCGYLVWRGRWRAACLLAAVAVGVNLLPDLVAPCPTASTWLGGWYQAYLAPMQQPNYAPGNWAAAIYYNQSLGGAVNRLFLSQWTWTDGHMDVLPRDHAPDAHTMKLVLLGCEALLVAACAFLWWRRPRPNADAPPAALPSSLEYSLVLLLMVLLSPMSSKSHFSTLIVPGFALARAAWQQRSPLLWGVFALANVIGLCALDWWGKYVALVSLYYGAVSFKALLLLAGCGLALTLLRRIPASPALAVNRVAA